MAGKDGGTHWETVSHLHRGSPETGTFSGVPRDDGRETGHGSPESGQDLGTGQTDSFVSAQDPGGYAGFIWGDVGHGRAAEGDVGGDVWQPPGVSGGSEGTDVTGSGGVCGLGDRGVVLSGLAPSDGPPPVPLQQVQTVGGVDGRGNGGGLRQETLRLPRNYRRHPSL